MRTRFAVAPSALPWPQVLLCGDDLRRHECFEDAVQDLCARRGLERVDLWLRPHEGALGVFLGRSCGVQRPVACLYDPVEYQAARSRGDLDESRRGRLTRPPHFRQAGGCNPGLALTPTNDTMSKPSKDPEAKPATLTYLVTSHELIFQAKRHPKDSLLEATARDAAKRPLATYLEQGWVRLATDEEAAAPRTPAPAAALDRQEVSATVSAPRALSVQVQTVPLERIKPDPTQPRRDFSPESMAELVASVRATGVEQAILVRPMSRWRQIVAFVARAWVRQDGKPAIRRFVSTDFWSAGIETSVQEMLDEGGFMGRLVAEGRIERTGASFLPLAGAVLPPAGDRALAGESEWLEIVYGERRWRAAQAAGLTEIPAKVRELTDIEAAEKQAVENLDRADLNALEVAAQYRKLLDLPGYGMARLVATTGIAKNTIHGKLKLLVLPEEGRTAMLDGRLGVVTAERIGRLEARIQERALQGILHPRRELLERGAKTLSDRQCREVIEEAQEAVAKEDRWTAAGQEAAARGVTPLAGKEADDEETWYESGEPKYSSRYVSLTQTCWDHPKHLTWGKLLGKAVADVPRYLGRDKKGNGHEWMLKTQAEAKAKELGIKLGSRGGGGSASGASAAEKAREAAERKKAQLQRQAESAGLAEVVATIEAGDLSRLPSEFWRVLGAIAAKDLCSDSGHRLRARRKPGTKRRDGVTFAPEVRAMAPRAALGFLVEALTVGMRGPWRLAENLRAVREALGLSTGKEPAPAVGTDWDGEGEGPEESANARTATVEEEQEALT